MPLVPVGPVVKKPTLVITYTGAEDLSAHLVAADLSSTSDIIDVGTFSAPSKQDVGRPQYTFTASFIWSETFYVMLEDHVDEEGTAVFTPDTTAGTASAGYFTFNCKFGHLPIGKFAIGEKVEVDVVFAVTSDPAWTDSVSA